jgi:hypothetical protein
MRNQQLLKQPKQKHTVLQTWASALCVTPLLSPDIHAGRVSVTGTMQQAAGKGPAVLQRKLPPLQPPDRSSVLVLVCAQSAGLIPNLMWFNETISPGVTTPSKVLGRVRSCHASLKGSKGGTGGGGGATGASSMLHWCAQQRTVCTAACVTAHQQSAGPLPAYCCWGADPDRLILVDTRAWLHLGHNSVFQCAAPE